MKFLKLIIISLGAGVLCSLAISCAKINPALIAATQNLTSNTATIQVYNASVPATSGATARNYVYVDNKPVTGAGIGYGSFFPSTASGFGLTSGFHEFLIKDTLVTASPAQPQLSFAENFQAGGHYTIFMYDTVTQVKQKTVFTNIVIPPDTTARVRFANFSYYPAATNGIDIFSKYRNAYVVQGLKHTDVTDFIAYASNINDTLYVTENGNAANKLDTLNGFFPTRLRSYTLIFRGRWRTNEGGAAPNPRVLSAFANN